VPNEQFMNSLLNHASVDGSKSTVLKPLGWSLALILPTILASSYLKVDNWITIMFAIAFCCILSLYLFAYIYFMKTDSDALRSEKYSLKKMEIQKTMIGDSDTGLYEVDPNKIVSKEKLELQGSCNE